MANSALWNEGSSTFNEVDNSGGNTGGGSNYTPPTAQPRQEFVVKGFGLSATKIGKIADIHSQITAAGDGEEYWPHAVNAENIPNWPYQKYPVVLYSSSDHSKGEGGIQVRVFNAELGDITDPAAWEEWQNVSSRSEFSHITQKSSPVYYDAGSNQTETPSIIFKDGLVYMFYHTNSSPGTGYPITVQNTHLAVSSNGIDFTLEKRSVLTFNPRYDLGKGHTGYANVVENPFELYGYDYLANSAHGGPRAFWGSDDLKNWVELELTGRTEGDFTPYAPEGTKWWLEPQTVASLRKDGAYWRMVYNFRRNSYKGGDDAPIFPVEFLLDERFNIVSAPNFFTQLGGTGEFDQFEMMHYSEIEYDGKRYGFYKGADSSNVTSIGMVELTESVIDWTILRPHSERTIVQQYTPSDYSGLTAIGNTTLTATTEEINFTAPLDGSTVGVKAPTIVIDDYDMVDILVRKNSKVEASDISGLVGLFDDPLSIQEALSLRWPAVADGIEELTLDVYANGALTRESLEFEVGVADGDGLNQGAEDPRAPATMGFRIVPSERVFFVLNGNTPTSKHDLGYVNTSIPLTPSLIFNVEDGVDGNVDFEGIDIIAYSNDAIAVPDAPITSVSKTTDTVTLTASSVSGATGYKYFLDGVEQDNGTFTGLQPDTEYTVYTRASNALGDSAPSTIQTVTTNDEPVPNTPPTANAGPDQSVAAGVTVQLDASNSEAGTYPIDFFEWTQTAGDLVTLTDATTSTPEFTAPSTSSEQTLTFSVVPVDIEGNRGTAMSVSIVVAAFIFTGSSLELLDTLDFTLVTDGNIIAYPGRANREILKVIPSSLLGLDVDADDYINFEGNDIVKVEVIVFTSRERQVLSSETDSVFRVEGSLKVRFGDLNFTYFTEPAALGIVVYVAGDTRGVVLTAPAVNDTSQVLFYQKAGVI